MFDPLKILFHKKSKIILLLGVILVGFFSTSCKKPKPQLPSNKIQVIDSSEVKLREYNRNITLNEDSAIVQFLALQNLEFSKTESGIWYYFEKKSNLKQIVEERSVTFSYQAFSFEGIMLDLDDNKTVELGKKQVPTGLEEGLKLMKKGEIARFIVPSYLAYGSQGNERIAPYTTIIYFVETK